MRSTSYYDSSAGLIGNTPLCKLQRFGKEGANLFLKLEQFNPGGSIKDRTALGMITRAEQEGLLRPGMHLIESSSGNTAIGLAMLARERSYSITAICDRYVPAAKRSRLRGLGANVIFLPATPSGMDTVELRIKVANWLATNIPNTVSLGQYSNPANPDIHYRTTGPEIWDGMRGQLEALVVAVGTCGTISGVGRFIKEQRPHVRIVAVEPHGSVVFGGENHNYLIQGGGLSFTPSILDKSVVDEAVKVTDNDAIRAIHQLAATDGWLVGGTGGLVVHTMACLSKRYGPGANIVGIIPDGGERYLDTLFEEEWLHTNGFSFRDRPAATQADLIEAVMAVGCSLNTIPGEPGIAIEDLERRVSETRHAVS